MGTHVPMFIPKLGLIYIKQGQTYACPQLWAFCILLWLILYFWEDRSSALSLSVGFSQNFWLSLDTSGLFELAKRNTPHNALKI